MNMKDVVIVWLSLQIAVMSILWMRAEKRVSYYEGQHDLQEWASQAQDEACGPYEQPVTKRRGHK